MPEVSRNGARAPPALSDPDWPRVVEGLALVPQNPRSVKGSENLFNAVQLFVDYLTTVPPRIQKAMAPLRTYPDGFEKVRFKARDGVELVGWLGRAADASKAPRDAILLVPGIYTSKDNARIRARAVRFLREWGFHVLCLDLRGVGESQRVFTTPGWKESEDIIDALAFLRSSVHVRRAHLYCESLAAASALLAAASEAQAGRRLLDGRVLVMSPYADAAHIVDLYGTATPEKTTLGRDFVIVQRFFNGLLRLQGYKGGRFDAYVRDGAKHYGLSMEETLRRSSPSQSLADVNVPVLVVHSRDDGLVPVAEAEELARCAQGNPNVHVWILPWGYHCLYEMADPDWYWRVLASVFGADEAAPKEPSAASSARVRAARP